MLRFTAIKLCHDTHLNLAVASFTDHIHSAHAMRVPLLDLQAQFESIQEEISTTVNEIIASQRFILGPAVESFEAACCDYLGAPHAIGVSSGTDAELVLLMALEYGPGDAVLTTPYTFFATAGSIYRTGARPVFTDIDPETYQLCPVQLRAFLETKCSRDSNGALRDPNGLHVRAIMPVHLYGTCADMTALRAVAEEYGLPLLEDAAQAFGTQFAGDPSFPFAGTIGEAGFYSFYPSKNLGGFGDGGLAVCRDAALAEKIRALRNHGMTKRYYHSMVGGNFRLDALQAGALNVKLRHLDDWSARRRDRAKRYVEGFTKAGLTGSILEMPPQPWAGKGAENHHIFHQFIVRLKAGNRDELRDFLTAREIGTEIYYPVPLHLQECFSGLGYQEGDLPHSEAAARETLALPIYPELSDEQIDYVVETFATYFSSEPGE